MLYKGTYAPSFLLEPDTNVYKPFDQIKPLLDRNEKRTSFSDEPLATHNVPRSPLSEGERSQRNSEDDWEDDNSDSEGVDEEDYPNPFPGASQPEDLPSSLLANLKVIEQRSVRPFLMTSVADHPGRRQELLTCVAALGATVASRAVFFVPSSTFL